MGSDLNDGLQNTPFISIQTSLLLWSKETSAAALAASLRDVHGPKLAPLGKLTKKEMKKLKSPVGKVPDTILCCKLCQRKKHDCKWELYRSDKDDRRICRGGTCKACSRAAELLRITRSPELIQAKGCADIVVQVSHSVRQAYGAKDVCTYFQCSRSVWFVGIADSIAWNLGSQAFVCVGESQKLVLVTVKVGKIKRAAFAWRMFATYW